MKVHHIGYAVKNLQQALDMFQMLDYDIVAPPVKDEKRKVEIAFVKNNGYLVELISPLNAESPIQNYLGKIGNTPYHLCYEVDKIDETIAELRSKRFLIVESPSEAVAMNDRKVAFMFNPKYGLLELLEKSE
jgi:methylmalonyl-CoA/ethylmalonyl-CoA epimerase